MGFSRQEYWSGVPFPSPWDLPDPGIEPGSPALWADALPSEPSGKPRVPRLCSYRLNVVLSLILGGICICSFMLIFSVVNK